MYILQVFENVLEKEQFKIASKYIFTWKRYAITKQYLEWKVKDEPLLGNQFYLNI